VDEWSKSGGLQRNNSRTQTAASGPVIRAADLS
jgi:hypothetical protein